MKLFTKTLLATALVAASPLALAAQQSDSMTVSITIQNVCTVAANDMNFGTHADLSTARTASTTVSVACSGNGPIQVSLNAGTGGASTYTTRQMADASGNTINFNLYTQANGAGSVIGDGTGSTVLLANTTATGNNTADSFTVHGYVPVQAGKAGGTYSSNLQATVTY